MAENPPPDTIRSQDFKSIEVLRVPVTSIKTPLFQPTFARMLTEILTSHGVQVQIETGYCLLTFPEGTYKTEVLPRAHDERYKVVLADGFELLEVKRRGEEFSYLQIERSQLSPFEQLELEKSDTALE